MRTGKAAAALGLALTAIAGCGDRERTIPTTASATAAAALSAKLSNAGAEREQGKGPRRSSAGDRPESAEPPEPSPRDDDAAKRAAARAAEAAYEDYIAAINERDGDRLCALLPPGAERTLRPAVPGDSCGARIGDSIGYEDPRGFPVWKETTLNGFDSISVGRDLHTARVTAAIVTAFADRTEPSVESDIAYLERVAGRWRLAKPSGALYRAIGQPEIPPSVISPP